MRKILQFIENNFLEVILVAGVTFASFCLAAMAFVIFPPNP